MTTEIMITVPESGSIIDVPLNRLKKSPKNARRTPHGEPAIAALAASIAVKGVLQAPVVEPELNDHGVPTGCYFVTIGEGRRLALLQLAKQKKLRKDALVRCVVDTAHDAHEISLDENVTRTAMHPADEFEAFQRLTQEQGLGAEEIGARFGVSAAVVKRRLRLAAVSPMLLQKYRDDELTLDQLMAFAVVEDHARQEQVYEAVSWNRSPSVIRRAMTEGHVRADDKRARFVGTEAYEAAGGRLTCDLFADNGEAWFEDAALLDRLALERLLEEAEAIREREGWLWAEAVIDHPHDHGLRRVHPRPVERSEEDRERIAQLGQTYDALITEWDGVEEIPGEVEARFAELDAELKGFGEDHAYDPDEVAIAGIFVSLAPDGALRTVRGFVRPQDEAADDEQEATDEVADPEGEARVAPLSEKLVADLTAHRSAALGNELAEHPDIALMAVAHALALRAFYTGEGASTCIEVRMTPAPLTSYAASLPDSVAGRASEARHEGWARDLPKEVSELWPFIVALPLDRRLGLIAHCAGLALNAVQTWEKRPRVMAHAAQVAKAVGLDMTRYWSPTTETFLARVTKAQIVEAVQEGASQDAAIQIAGLKKSDMAVAAEEKLAGTGWLPEPLRSPQDAQ